MTEALGVRALSRNLRAGMGHRHTSKHVVLYAYIHVCIDIYTYEYVYVFRERHITWARTYSADMYICMHRQKPVVWAHRPIHVKRLCVNTYTCVYMFIYVRICISTPPSMYPFVSTHCVNLCQQASRHQLAMSASGRLSHGGPRRPAELRLSQTPRGEGWCSFVDLWGHRV